MLLTEESKGRNIDDAVPQLEAAAKKCATELPGFLLYYRIVASKVRTHDVHKNSFRKFQDKCGGRLKYSTGTMIEKLD